MGQSDKSRKLALHFLSLHKTGDPFVLMNAWDVGSAKLCVANGAKAIGTSSSALAFTLGLKDNGSVSRDVAIDHAGAIAEAVPVPVSADLEHGYGDDPDAVYQTIRLAIEAGLAGACIEDVNPLNGEAYPNDLARYRIEAALGAIKDLEADFVLTARADGVMHGLYDLSEAITRIQRFEKSGAQVVFVPMPSSVEDLKRVVQSTTCPVNAIAAGQFLKLSLFDYTDIGIARVSLGSSLARCIHQTTHETSKTLLETGEFSSLSGGMLGAEVDDILTNVGSAS